MSCKHSPGFKFHLKGGTFTASYLCCETFAESWTIDIIFQIGPMENANPETFLDSFTTPCIVRTEEEGSPLSAIPVISSALGFFQLFTAALTFGTALGRNAALAPALG
jgi:hypothetical protein